MMHEVLLELRGRDLTATATIGIWSAPASIFRWVTCGDVLPMLIHADDELELLEDGLPRLGDSTIRVHERRLNPGERLMLLSDGLLGRKTRTATRSACTVCTPPRSKRPRPRPRAPSAPWRTSCDNVIDPLDDDATMIVLAPNPDEIGRLSVTDTAAATGLSPKTIRRTAIHTRTNFPSASNAAHRGAPSHPAMTTSTAGVRGTYRPDPGSPNADHVMGR